jgi:hypothetical protein
VSATIRPILLSSCARAASAAEARFRIDRPIGGRSARVVALDDGAADIVRRLAGRQWQGARFYTCEAPTSSGSGDMILRGTGGTEVRLSEELADADVAIMLATAGGRAEAASAIAQNCALRGIATAGLILGRRLDVAPVLTALRPYARVLMVTEDEDDVSEVLTALRA